MSDAIEEQLAELRKLQEPLKKQYKEDAGSATIVLKAQGDLNDSSLTCNVETGRAMVRAGLHPKSGGTGIEACSGDMCKLYLCH